MEKIYLKNGNEISNLCYGTGVIYTYGKSSRFMGKIKYWVKNIFFFRDFRRMKKDLSVRKIVDVAMLHGCNMFDTSRAYGGAEYELGKALRKYNRKDYYLITKLCNKDQYEGSVRAALEKSLDELNVDYVDLYLMHWPVKDHYIDSWKEMEQLYREGKCKAIGVCNCNIHHLKEIEQNAEIMPMVNQFECHPLFTQVELREYCRKKNIQVMAYTSTARYDERLKKTALVDIARKHNKSVVQIILRWHQQIGNIPIVNSTNVKHFMENTQIYDFILNEDEIATINAININSRLRYDPDNCDFTKL